jgi:hypothetical protein
MLRKPLAVLLILALVLPLLQAALSLFSISGWALRRSFYRELLGEQSLYDALLEEARAARDRPWELEPGASWPGWEGLPAEAVAKALAQTVGASYLRDQAAAGVESFFDSLEGSPRELSLDLRPLKRELASGSRQRFADALAAALPSCLSGQDPLEPRTRLPACRPSGMSVQRASQLVQAALPAALQRLPERWLLLPEADAAALAGVLGAVRPLWAAVILALVAAAFWIAAAFLGGRNRAEVTSFLGWTLLPPALLTLAAGLAVRFAFLGRWLVPWRWSAGGELWLEGTLRAALQTVARGFLITGGVSLGLCLGLLAWWSTIRRES